MTSVLQEINLSGLRNLAGCSLQCSPKVNICFGENGEGKTSLIEAIYLLGMGKSFRTNRLEQVISYGQRSCIINGRLLDGLGTALQIKIKQGASKEFYYNEKSSSSVAKIAKTFPLQLINAASFDILVAGPQKRKAFLDWVLFHVEQQFLPVWRQYCRILQQRNAWLKTADGRRSHQQNPWDEQFCEAGEQITVFREQMLIKWYSQLKRILMTEIKGLDWGGLTVSYEQGWTQDKSLEDALKHSKRREQLFGYSVCGPHRADISLQFRGRPVKDVLSRGQMKRLVLAMFLAANDICATLAESRATLLLDDLPSELDESGMSAVLNAIQERSLQCFITSIELNGPLLELVSRANVSAFHVEHGEFSLAEAALQSRIV